MQEKNASRQKYYAAEGFDPLLDPELLWQFSSRNGKSSSISPLAHGFRARRRTRDHGIHSQRWLTRNGRLNRAVPKVRLTNFASTRPTKLRAPKLPPPVRPKGRAPKFSLRPSGQDAEHSNFGI